MEVSEQKSKINFKAFLWHSAFLALASNFMDVDTIIPSMLIKAGVGICALRLFDSNYVGRIKSPPIILCQFFIEPVFEKKIFITRD